MAELTKAEKLRAVADVLDMYDDFAWQVFRHFGTQINWEGFPLDFTGEEDNKEMQRDLREWANDLEEEAG